MFSWYVALEEDASMMASVLGRGLHVVVGICEIFSWGSLKLNLRMKHFDNLDRYTTLLVLMSD